METAYLETTVIGHLVGHLRRNSIIATRQAFTRQWWKTASSQYRFVVSQLVIEECSHGDPIVARERLEMIESLPLLDVSEAVDRLANELMARGAVPSTEPRDAFHVAVAAVNGIQYIVTWNFKHIANARMRLRIETVCRDAGFEPPIICTPEELAGEEDDVQLSD